MHSVALRKLYYSHCSPSDNMLLNDEQLASLNEIDPGGENFEELFSRFAQMKREAHMLHYPHHTHTHTQSMQNHSLTKKGKCMLRKL